MKNFTHKILYTRIVLIRLYIPHIFLGLCVLCNVYTILCILFSRLLCSVLSSRRPVPCQFYLCARSVLILSCVVPAYSRSNNCSLKNTQSFYLFSIFFLATLGILNIVYYIQHETDSNVMSLSACLHGWLLQSVSWLKFAWQSALKTWNTLRENTR